MLSPKPRLFKVEKLGKPAGQTRAYKLDQAKIYYVFFLLGTETGLRAWFGCHVTANTIGRVTIMPSLIVNKERLVPLEVLKL